MLRHCLNSQAIWLLCTGAREAAFRNIKSIAECLSDELINAAKVRQDMCQQVVIGLFAGLLQQLRYQEEGRAGACRQVQQINLQLSQLLRSSAVSCYTLPLLLVFATSHCYRANCLRISKQMYFVDFLQ